jgi:ketosteroid isomerase-like protein
MSEPSATDVPPAVTRMVEATNAADSAAFVDAFADDAYLEDWGRGFRGRDGIAQWNQSDNIGRQSHFEVRSVRAEGDGVVVTLEVTGGGFNGTSDFYFEVDGDAIRTMIIRAD